MSSQTAKKGMAIASMVLGIMSVTCFSVLAGIPAIVLGHIAYSRARRSPEEYGGEGQAMAGFIMGYISFALVPILAMMAAIAIPDFVKARSTAQQHACINNLRMIDAAKEQWALENKKTVGTPVVITEVNAYLPNGATPICPAGGVYAYNVLGTPPTCSLGEKLGHQLPPQLRVER